MMCVVAAYTRNEWLVRLEMTTEQLFQAGVPDRKCRLYRAYIGAKTGLIRI